MRIAIDIRKINEFGVGTYIWNLVRNIACWTVSDIADEVPDVSSNPEFIDLPNINRDSHSRSTQV